MLFVAGAKFSHLSVFSIYRVLVLQSPGRQHSEPALYNANMSKFQIGVNDDRELYVWRDTWKEDTVGDFLTRLSTSTTPQLDRSGIHLSFDGVRLGETTTMREVRPAVLFENPELQPDSKHRLVLQTVTNCPFTTDRENADHAPVHVSVPEPLLSSFRDFFRILTHVRQRHRLHDSSERLVHLANTAVTPVAGMKTRYL